jgi:hypothetical protein
MNTRFNLFIDTENDAFKPDPSPELARILRAIADRIESGEFYGHYLTIRDTNGNDVGRFALKNPRVDPGAGPHRT